jgi:hypothetical protein
MTSANKKGRPTTPSLRKPESAKQKQVIVASIIGVGFLIAITFIALGNRGIPSGIAKPLAAGYAIGTPGPGVKAPDFTLPSTSGGNVTLPITVERRFCYFSMRALGVSHVGTRFEIWKKYQQLFNRPV